MSEVNQPSQNDNPTRDITFAEMMELVPTFRLLTLYLGPLPPIPPLTEAEIKEWEMSEEDVAAVRRRESLIQWHGWFDVDHRAADGEKELTIIIDEIRPPVEGWGSQIVHVEVKVVPMVLIDGMAPNAIEQTYSFDYEGSEGAPFEFSEAAIYISPEGLRSETVSEEEQAAIEAIKTMSFDELEDYSAEREQQEKDLQELTGIKFEGLSKRRYDKLLDLLAQVPDLSKLDGKIIAAAISRRRAQREGGSE